MSNQVRRLLEQHREQLHPVIPLSLERPVVLDLGDGNRGLAEVDLADAAQFSAYVDKLLAHHQTPVGIGRYNEDRVIYRHSGLFAGAAEPRSIHLGIDLFVAAGTAVHAPLPATLHSCAENRGIGDYGPTIILEHDLDGCRFFTLYGHLSRDSLLGKQAGQTLARGAELGRIGERHENGGWPPHLHLQLITDMLGKTGDFPGVASATERERWLERCPDASLLLGRDGSWRTPAT